MADSFKGWFGGSEEQQQIPFGNDKGKSEEQQQIPFGNDK
jgi:hypothetical protein